MVLFSDRKLKPREIKIRNTGNQYKPASLAATR